MANHPFWRHLDILVAGSRIVIDRPRGSTHPRFPDFVYPYDYGYLEGTVSGDGEGIDVWIGSLPDRQVTGIVCTVNLDKNDSEIKILLGCTDAETREIVGIHNTENWAGLLVERPKTHPTT